jgi:predicted nucleic acid-binding protein
MRNDLTAYDAAYLSLAEALEGRLITRDRALATAGGRVRVEVI